VRNATAAVAVGIGLDIPVADIVSGLAEFSGVDRRFQIKGQAAGATVIDDYGHHPTEIKATLSAARQCGYRKIHVIFQPHRYTRTRDLLDDFAQAFVDADTVTVLDIYAASEEPIPGITGEVLARTVSRFHPQCAYADSFETAIESTSTRITPGDMVITLGAGNVSQLGPLLVSHLAAQKSRETGATKTG
jgi:UDP-N-acetylmuramate--alanine ligase